jgi:excisionase family DNA binding protein
VEKLLTPEEVADRLAIKPRTVIDWLRTGRLKGVKLGKVWRVTEEDLSAFVESNRS